MSSRVVDFPSFEARREWQASGMRKKVKIPLIAGGVALAAVGISRRSFPGVLLATGGGLLIVRALTANGAAWTGPIRIRKSVTINRSPQELYQFWRNFENLPKFMRHLQGVSTLGPRRSHWVTAGPRRNYSWDAEIIQERENELIAWRSLPSSDVETEGRVEFKSSGERGTEVFVNLTYRPPAGGLGETIALLFGRHPEQQIREDLRRFKELMEAGEIPTTDRQPHGRRSRIGKLVKRVSAYGRTDEAMGAERVLA
jgi:uncharacterized membrane protein